MEKKKVLKVPSTVKVTASPRTGDMYYISRTTCTAHDAAHLCLIEMLKRGEEIPFDFEGQVVYCAGPCPAKPGQLIGSIGPATGERMDAYSPALTAYGLRMMIDKSLRSPEAVNAIKQYKGIYSAAAGGATALMGKCVREAEVIVFDDLGPEVIRKLCVEEFPVTVVVNSLGGDVYLLGRSQCACRQHLGYNVRSVITCRMNGASVPHSAGFSCLGTEIRASQTVGDRAVSLFFATFIRNESKPHYGYRRQESTLRPSGGISLPPKE